MKMNRAKSPREVLLDSVVNDGVDTIIKLLKRNNKICLNIEMPFSFLNEESESITIFSTGEINFRYNYKDYVGYTSMEIPSQYNKKRSQSHSRVIKKEVLYKGLNELPINDLIIFSNNITKIIHEISKQEEKALEISKEINKLKLDIRHKKLLIEKWL